MAKPSWIQLDKESGSGNGSVNITAASQNTGRNARSGVLTYSAANCEDVVQTVNQAGKPEFVTIQGTATVSKTGGNVTLSGKSNSKRLILSLGTGGTLDITLPSKYTANSVETDNGVNITGDPGATSEYNFSITISGIAENTSINELTKQLIVTDDGGHTATCAITQAAGDAYLEVSPVTIELAWDGATGATATVTSNTSWTVA